MRLIWSLDNLHVTVTGLADAPEPGFEGFAIAPNGKAYQWTAFPRPAGYEVFVLDSTAKSKTHRGTTFNLAYEVAWAVMSYLADQLTGE